MREKLEDKPKLQYLSKSNTVPDRQLPSRSFREPFLNTFKKISFDNCNDVK